MIMMIAQTAQRAQEANDTSTHITSRQSSTPYSVKFAAFAFRRQMTFKTGQHWRRKGCCMSDTLRRQSRFLHRDFIQLVVKNDRYDAGRWFPQGIGYQARPEQSVVHNVSKTSANAASPGRNLLHHRITPFRSCDAFALHIRLARYFRWRMWIA